jgi:hypothetical protein
MSGRAAQFGHFETFVMASQNVNNHFMRAITKSRRRTFLLVSCEAWGAGLVTYQRYGRWLLLIFNSKVLLSLSDTRVRIFLPDAASTHFI